MDRDIVLARLREHETALRARGVAHASLFGSRARGDAGPDSDTDIMIEFDPAARISAYDYVDLKAFIAGLFDEILGVANIAAGVGAMTGTLTIVYRSPTPLYTEVTLEAHTTSIEGRKVRTVGTLSAGDRLCAEAHGIFILVEHERFATHTRAHGADAP